jgi:hypothetical protein
MWIDWEFFFENLLVLYEIYREHWKFPHTFDNWLKLWEEIVIISNHSKDVFAADDPIFLIIQLTKIYIFIVQSFKQMRDDIETNCYAKNEKNIAWKFTSRMSAKLGSSVSKKSYQYCFMKKYSDTKIFRNSGLGYTNPN